MFTSQTTIVTSATSVTQPAKLVDMDVQISHMTSQFLNTAYSIAWLGQSLPPFTTRQESFAPFSSLSTDYVGATDTLTTNTTRYWTDLTCWSPSTIVINASSTDAAQPNSTSFDDGRGCIANNVVNFSPSDASSYGNIYAGAYFSSQLTYNFSTDYANMCRYTPHRILAVWRRLSVDPPDFTPDGDATAIFCEADYFMQSVTLTVYGANNTVKGFVATGEKAAIPDTIFNKTDFESVIVNGLPPFPNAGSSNWSTLTTDIADAAAVQQSTRLQSLNMAAPVARSSTSMIGFMVGSTQLQPTAYLNTESLQESLTSAHQLLFATAMGSLLQKPSEFSQSANIQSSTTAVRVVPGFIIATEVLLAFVAITILGLLLQLRRMRLKLTSNPDCLASLMLLSRHKTIQEAFNISGNANENDLKLHLSNYRFALRSTRDAAPALVADAKVHPPHLVSSSQQHLALAELSRISVCSVILVAAAAFAGLLALSSISNTRGGLPLPYTDNLRLQLLLNLLPTAFATLLGAYVALLCRSYSFLKPLESLQKGEASAASTLLVKYTSLPPQLLFWEAFTVGHYLLGSLSVMALVSNILTVTMASLFIQSQGVSQSNTSTSALYQPVIMDLQNFDGGFGTSSQVDSVYPTIANLSDLATLPTWTSPSLGYLPVANFSSGQIENSEIVLEADGYGAELDCMDLSMPPANINAKLEFADLGKTFNLEVNYSDINDGGSHCRLNHHIESDDGSGVVNGALSSTPSSFEISNFMEATNSSSIPDTYFCGNLTVKGWVRGWLAYDQSTNQSTFHHNATVISCKPRLKIQHSLLQIKADGSIIQETPIGLPTYELPVSLNFSSTIRTTIVTARDEYDEPIWHQDTIARDWSNYMYKKALNNTSLLDPDQPLPSAEQATQLVSSIFSRLFAVQLSLDRYMLLPLNVSAKSLSLWNTTGLPDGPPGSYNISAQLISPTRRIFISQPNFVISTIILGLDIVVLIVFAMRISGPFLPRMPFTIASQMAFFAGSHVIDDVVNAGGDLRELDSKGYKYSYGHFIGKDGRAHIGIERAPFVFRSKNEEREKSLGVLRRMVRWLKKSGGPDPSRSYVRRHL